MENNFGGHHKRTPFGGHSWSSGTPLEFFQVEGRPSWLSSMVVLYGCPMAESPQEVSSGL
jgi:hypothetical protein